MKKNTIAKLLTAALCTGLIAGMTTGCGSASSASGENGQVIVYNWGEYIDPDTITMFEEETGIKVVYDEFETNEIMYPEVETGASEYDVPRQTSANSIGSSPRALIRKTNIPFLTAGEPSAFCTTKPW